MTDYEITLYQRMDKNPIAKPYKAVVTWTRHTYRYPDDAESDEMLSVSEFRDFYGMSRREALKSANTFVTDRRREEDAAIPLWVEIPIDY